MRIEEEHFETKKTKYAEILHLTGYELAFCLAYFLVALIICLYSTPRGSLFSPDSTAYVFDAENFLDRFPHYYVGVMYPVLVAIGMALGITSERSAAIVPIISYSLLGFPLFLLSKIISRPIAGFAACIICLFCGKFLLYISTYAWTDMPYLLFSVLALLFLAIYNKYGNLSSVTFAGIFTLLAELTRDIGITLAFAGLLIIIININELKKSLISLSDYCIISIILFFIWRNNISRTGYNITTTPSNPALDVIIHKFREIMEQFFYIDYKPTILIIIMIFFLSLLYLALNNQLTILIKDTLPITSYTLIYSIILILMTSSFWISVDGGMLDIRKVVQIYPYIALSMVSFFVYIYYTFNDKTIKIVFKAISIILLISLAAQGSYALYSLASDIRKQSINDYADRDLLKSYISDNNITALDTIYIERNTNWAKFFMVLRDSKSNESRYRIIENRIPGLTILDNLTSYNWRTSARSLTDLIKENKNHSIYIIVPNKVAKCYLKNSSKDFCLSSPQKFSATIIYKVELKENDSCCPESFITTNLNSFSIPLVGDFMGSKNDQLLLLSRNPQRAENNNLQVIDFGKGLPGEIKYNEDWPETLSLANLPNTNSTLLAGDFLDLGYSQALFINHDPKGDKAIIEDFSQEKLPAIIRYSEVLGDNSTLKELFNSNNTRHAGNFQGLGYSQVLFIDHNSEDGKLAIVDFRKGRPHAFTEISEIGDDLIPLASLLDRGNIQLAGDFMGLGHSQVLFLNRNHSKTETAKIVISDFSKVPPSIKYLEKWGESSLFGGWLDANDTQLVGDFMGLGHSQVLFVNHLHKGGKIMIADFSQGKPPASNKFGENWDKGIMFEGWLDINDSRVAGDFAGLGYDQILFLNSSHNGIRGTIVDFKNSMPIPI